MTIEPARQTQRFARRRGEILDVATDLINVSGTRGMTLTAVAKALSLDTSSVTYYFKRKDLLASACLERTLIWLRDAARAAGAEPDTRSRARHFLHRQFELHRQQRSSNGPRLAILSDMRALEADAREPLNQLYAEMFDIVRSYFEFGDGPGMRSRSLISTVVLISSVHWMPTWAHRYLDRDLDRVEQRLFDFLDQGIGIGDRYPLDITRLDDEEPADAQPVSFTQRPT